MKHTLQISLILILLLLMGGASVHAGPGRLTAYYIGPVTLNNGSGPHSVGVPDSVVYTYSGSRAVYDVATTYELDTVNHSAKIIALDNYTYTSADSLLTDVAQTVLNGTATNAIRVSRAYDAAGNDTLLLNESWNVASSTWVGTFRTIYTFNGARQMTGLLQQTWDAVTSTWVNFNRFAYQYDALGRDSFKVQQKWVAATNTWKNVTGNTTLYTSFGKVATINSQRWSDTTSTWKDSSFVVNHYNGSNFLQSTIVGPLVTSGGLRVDSLTTLTWNAAGLPLTQISFIRFGSGGQVPQFRYTFSYNAANQLLSNQTEVIDNMYVAYNSLTGYYTYNSAGQVTLQEPISPNQSNTLLDKEQYRFYYEGTTAVPIAPATGAGAIAVYPSPATGIVTLSLSSDWEGIVNGTVQDLSGRTWQHWSEPVSAGYKRQISVTALPAGIYSIRLSGSGFSGCRILIVQH